jgi:hypothetical protein
MCLWAPKNFQSKEITSLSSINRHRDRNFQILLRLTSILWGLTLCHISELVPITADSFTFHWELQPTQCGWGFQRVTTVRLGKLTRLSAEKPITITVQRIWENTDLISRHWLAFFFIYRFKYRLVADFRNRIKNAFRTETLISGLLTSSCVNDARPCNRVLQRPVTSDHVGTWLHMSGPM